MDNKVVLLKSGSGEYKILGSSFVGYAFPCADLEQFKSIYDSLRKEHFKADHIPYALKIGAYTKCSDDGEPGATAGRPLLSLLENEGLDEACIIVARYFGGTKLGVPRLRRSFVEAASLALKASVKGEAIAYNEAIVELEYSEFESLKRQASKKDLLINKVDYGVNAVATLRSGGRIAEQLSELGIKALKITECGIATAIKEINND